MSTRAIDVCDYEKVADGLRLVAGVVDPERELAELAGSPETPESSALKMLVEARRKYDANTHEARRYTGMSVIHHIQPEDPVRMGVVRASQMFRNSVTRAKIADKLAFVKMQSVHVTTFDLTNRPEHSGLFESLEAYQSFRADVEKATDRYLDNWNPNFHGTVRIDGVCMFGPSVIFLKLDLDTDGAANMFKDFRTKLNQYLHRTVGNRYELLGRDFERELKLHGHITLAYVVKPLTEAEIGVLVDTLKAFNDDFNPISFDLTHGAITHFKSMDQYEAGPKKKKHMEGKIKIKLVRSPICTPEKQKNVVKGLGLRKVNQVVERPDTPVFRGMVKKVPHLLEVVE